MNIYGPFHIQVLENRVQRVPNGIKRRQSLGMGKHVSRLQTHIITASGQVPPLPHSHHYAHRA